MMARILTTMFFRHGVDFDAHISQKVDIRGPAGGGVVYWCASLPPRFSKLLQCPLDPALRVEMKRFSSFQGDTVSLCSLGFAAHFSGRARRRVAGFRMSHGLCPALFAAIEPSLNIANAPADRALP